MTLTRLLCLECNKGVDAYPQELPAVPGKLVYRCPDCDEELTAHSSGIFLYAVPTVEEIERQLELAEEIADTDIQTLRAMWMLHNAKDMAEGTLTNLEAAAAQLGATELVEEIQTVRAALLKEFDEKIEQAAAL